MILYCYNYGGILPVRAHPYDAGADVFIKNKIIVNPHSTIKIPLGFGIDIPAGYTACIHPRSSLGSKGITTHLAPIDTGYTGEINCILTNTSDNTVEIPGATAVGQLVIFPIMITDFTFDKIPNTRGSGAFGSTGHADVIIK